MCCACSESMFWQGPFRLSLVPVLRVWLYFHSPISTLQDEVQKLCCSRAAPCGNRYPAKQPALEVQFLPVKGKAALSFVLLWRLGSAVPRADFCVQAWGPWNREDADLLEWV